MRRGKIEQGKSDVGLFANVEDMMFAVEETVVLATFTQCPMNVQHLHYFS